MGTALAGIMSKNHSVTLWSRCEDQKTSLQKHGKNIKYLPDYKIPSGVDYTAGAIDWKAIDVVVLAVPTQSLREMCVQIELRSFKGPIINTAKGLELGSALTPCAILMDCGLKDALLYSLSGPSHAEEMSASVPTSVVLSGEKNDAVQKLLEIFAGTSFRPYFQMDRLGVELGGALKNVVAIAAGLSDGLGFGLNTKSAIITRGLREIKKYGVYMGAKDDTFNGLSCLGDLITTCCSPFSRNRAFGEALIREPEVRFKNLAEGASTVKSIYKEMSKLNFEMPICRGVYEISTGKKDALEVMKELISRPFREED